jgi:NDP-sugar pyrophosphorylase family protein
MKNVVIPMAGMGSRFIEAGYSIPKPFIPIKGKPMIEHVIDNISEPEDRVYLLCRLEHLDYIKSSNLMHRKNIAYIPVVGLTEGAACTVLLAEAFINSDTPLVIANSDQYIKYDKTYWEPYLELECGIMVFTDTNPKWSFARIVNNKIVEVAEKNPISDQATAGVYYFKKGSIFVDAAKRMIQKDLRVNNEFYVCPVFNEVIAEGYNVLPISIEAMYGLGTPEDLKANYSYIGI